MTATAIEEAGRLLRIASADFAACVVLIEAPGVRFANAAFHGQQAIEKSLKAAVTLRYDDMDDELLSASSLNAVVATMIEWATGRVVDIRENQTN
jgi:hypothetical protein